MSKDNVKKNSENADIIKEYIRNNFIKILNDTEAVEITPKLYKVMLKIVEDEFETSEIEKIILENFVFLLKSEHPLDIQPSLYTLMYETAEKYDANKKELDELSESVLNNDENDLIKELKNNIFAFKQG